MAGGGAVVGSGSGQLPGYGQQSVGLSRQSSAGGSVHVQGVSASYIQQQQQRQMAALQRQQQQQQQNNQFAGYPQYR